MGAAGEHAGAPVKKRSVVVAGHRTSISLEDEFWADLVAVAGARGVSLNALVKEVDATRAGNLSSALRLFVRACYRTGELPPRPERVENTKIARTTSVQYSPDETR